MGSCRTARDQDLWRITARTAHGRREKSVETEETGGRPLQVLEVGMWRRMKQTSSCDPLLKYHNLCR
jgi:hypothetical protein